MVHRIYTEIKNSYAIKSISDEIFVKTGIETAPVKLYEIIEISGDISRATLNLIKKTLVSYHEHSTGSCTEGIVERISGGQNCAIVTDAGMPCISDPGEPLIRLCYERNIPVKVIPGPSAVISALAVSGLDTSRFSFEGFLSVTKKQRIEHLEHAKSKTETMIFYEAPHKLMATLKDMLEYFGDRKISLCRELTKVYEEVIRLTLSEAIEYYKEKNPKGEYVLVIEGKEDNSEDKNITLEEALERVKALVENGVKTSDACKTVAKESTFKKGELYSAYCNTEQ
jgi:16S rRNA (cytidine1402-2'-O)-methyltransferase